MHNLLLNKNNCFSFLCRRTEWNIFALTGFVEIYAWRLRNKFFPCFLGKLVGGGEKMRPERRNNKLLENNSARKMQFQFQCCYFSFIPFFPIPKMLLIHWISHILLYSLFCIYLPSSFLPSNDPLNSGTQSIVVLKSNVGRLSLRLRVYKIYL